MKFISHVTEYILPCMVIGCLLSVLFSQMTFAQQQPSGSDIFGKSTTTTQTLSERRVQEAKTWRRFQQWLVQQQKQYYQEISAVTRDFAKTDNWQALTSLILFSFFYGVIHAAGPGHGKVLMTAYVMTQPTTRRKSLWVSFAAAMLQACVAIILVYAVLVILAQTTRVLTQTSLHTEGMSYILMGLVGIYLIYKTIKSTIIPYLGKRLHMPEAHAASRHPHTHEGACCDHGHVIEVTPDMRWREVFGLVLAMGVRPCSGALFILVFAYSLGAHLAGILSSFAMGIGTFLTVSVIALSAHSLRQLLSTHSLLGWVDHLPRLKRGMYLFGRFLSFSLPLAGGLLILLTAFILLQGVYGWG